MKIPRYQPYRYPQISYTRLYINFVVSLELYTNENVYEVLYRLL